MPRELVRVLDDDVLICLLRVRPSYFIVSECGTESCPGLECWVTSETTEQKEDHPEEDDHGVSCTLAFLIHLLPAAD
jgi:hypothetical protein